MALGNLLDDGQSQPGAIHARPQRSVEGLKDQFALGFGNAGPGVPHLQHQHLAKGVG